LTTFLLMTLAPSGQAILLNAEGISCILPDRRGCRIYLSTPMEDAILVGEDIAAISAALEARWVVRPDIPRDG